MLVCEINIGVDQLYNCIWFFYNLDSTTQVLAQLKEISSISGMHVRRKQNMEVLIGNKKAQVGVIVQKGDGFCLFRALVQQIFKMPCDTAEFHEKVFEFKNEVINFILENSDKYMNEIQHSLVERYGGCFNQYNKDDCEYYVDHKIRVEGWGGAETLKAVREIYEINIFVVYEAISYCTFTARFNSQFKRSICLAYRTSGNRYDHYDSISNIENDILVRMMAKEFQIGNSRKVTSAKENSSKDIDLTINPSDHDKSKYFPCSSEYLNIISNKPTKISK